MFLNNVKRKLVNIYIYELDKYAYKIFELEQAIDSGGTYAENIHNKYVDYLCNGHDLLAKKSYNEYCKCKSNLLKKQKKALRYYHIKCMYKKQLNKFKYGRFVIEECNY